MIHLDANGARISEAMGRELLKKMKEHGISEATVLCHPLQAISVCNLFHNVVVVSASEVDADLRKCPDKSRYTFMGFPLHQDSTRPEDEIMFISNCEPVARIYGLEVPTI
jgi:hypothetical protein